MEWQIIYLEFIDLWLNKLDKLELRSVAKELKLLELCGNQLKLPHSKSLGAGLFELRERKYGLRLYYIFNKEQKIVLLNAGNKGTQQKDIKKSRALLQQYKDQL